MNLEGTAVLLTYINQLDARIVLSETRVAAWSNLLTEQAPSLTSEEAQRFVTQHYANQSTAITPDLLVKVCREKEQAREAAMLPQDIDSHCGRTGCPCTHSGLCFKGWIDSQEGRATPCRQCRTALSLVLDEIAPIGSRHDHDHSRIQSKEYRQSLLDAYRGRSEVREGARRDWVK